MASGLLHRFGQVFVVAAMPFATLAPVAVSAQDLSPAAQAMQTAASICLGNYRTPENLAPALQNAGFDVMPGMDEGYWEFSGASVQGVAGGDQGSAYCVVGSAEVPLDLARGIGLGLAQALLNYELPTENGSPEGRRGTCDGLNVLVPQRSIWIHYSNAGNSGECVDDGTSSIILRM